MRTKAIRKDHHLMMEVCRIEEEIGKVCQELTEELGVHIGWSDARELAAGASMKDLLAAGESDDKSTE